MTYEEINKEISEICGCSLALDYCGNNESMREAEKHIDIHNLGMSYIKEMIAIGLNVRRKLTVRDRAEAFIITFRKYREMEERRDREFAEEAKALLTKQSDEIGSNERSAAVEDKIEKDFKALMERIKLKQSAERNKEALKAVTLLLKYLKDEPNDRDLDVAVLKRNLRGLNYVLLKRIKG